MERGRIKKLFEILRIGKNKLSTGKELLETIEKNKKPKRGESRNWPSYDNGAFDKKGEVDGYFGRSTDSFNELSTFETARSDFQSLAEAGKKSLSLDVMGQGRIGTEIGADLSLGWTYKKTPVPFLKNRKVEAGDLLQIDILKEMLGNLKHKIQSENYNLNAVWFRAIGGWGMYYDNLFAASYIYEEIFRELYSLANIGCKFYLSMNYGNEKRGSNQSRRLMKTLQENGYDVQSDKNGNHILTKTKNMETLPSLREISRENDLLGPNFEKLAKS